MIAYLDSSVLLRLVLGQKGRLEEWPEIETGVASALAEVECLRTLDRFRLLEGINETELATRREAIYRLLESLEVVEPTRLVLHRAAQSLPTTLGTLDAIHLATAALWQETQGSELVMATHDEALALASRATGMRVLGV